ncbi:MAG: 16S rRNA (uracil(1498)-N(3))-methyltransferase [Rhodospirillaceae bacterium]|nr:16S rRNA (uracil(1498)-N(3))-methyltransferase [Rhodospirillaceae bacterium]
MTYTPRTRLFVEAPLAAGAAVEAAEGQAHYLMHVMRAKAGDAVALFNGRDGEWSAKVAYPAKRKVHLEAGERLREQYAEPDVWLVFAPVKRIEFLVEKATELGARALHPVFTRRTTIGRVNRARLLANATEAAEQSDRLSVPEIMDARQLLDALGAWPEDRTLYFLDETGGGAPIAEVLTRARNDANVKKPIAFLTGPEGGFDQTELDALRRLPFAVPVGLGPRILRAETAALAALACWQALCGDWN